MQDYGNYLFFVRNDYGKGCIDFIECCSVLDVPAITRIKIGNYIGNDKEIIYFNISGVSKFEIKYDTTGALGFLSVYRMD